MLKILDVKSLMTELVNDIHTYENKREKSYEFEFDYYDDKQFKKLKKLIEDRNKGKEEDKQEHLKIIGNIDLRKPVKLEDYIKYANDDDKEVTLLKVNILDIEADYEQHDTYFEVSSPADTASYGYVRVGKYDYIRIEDGMAAVVVTNGRLRIWLKRIIRFILLSLILTLLLFGVKKTMNVISTYSIEKIIDKYIRGIDKPEDNKDKTLENTTDDFSGLETRKEQAVELEYIDVAGYANLLVYEDHQEIDLINLPENTVFQQYTIFLDDEKIFETKLIQPGKVVKWNAYETLPSGKHNVVFHISTYDYIEDENGNISVGGACNGAFQPVEIECRK